VVGAEGRRPASVLVAPIESRISLVSERFTGRERDITLRRHLLALVELDVSGVGDHVSFARPGCMR
jgi:hypothetical protein